MPKSLIDIPVTMHDGCVLSADIYLPNHKGSFPTILERTPYGNHQEKKVRLFQKFVRAGFAVCSVDVRGRHDSEGEWNPFFDERIDGIATQKWLAGQEFCDGNIGLFGCSYEGYAQWVTADSLHPAVKTMVPVVAVPDPVINLPYQDGALLHQIITWALLVHGKTNQDVSYQDWEKIFRYRPLIKLDEYIGFKSRFWKEWISHPHLDDYWKRACYMDSVTDVNVPVLQITGWYDDDGISTFRNYPALRQHGKNPDIRNQHKLVIGPWPHVPNTIPNVPGIDFGPDAIIDYEGLVIRWFRRWLMGESNGIENEAPAKVFIMGENRWRNLDNWSGDSVRTMNLFLSSSGSANHSNGDGKLKPDPPNKNEEPDRFTYDPNDPVPYIYDFGTTQVGGPHDQRAIEKRDDVLVYTTEEVETPLTLCGRVKVKLFTSTSGKDTDFTAKLCHVLKDGTSRQLCDGIKRVSKRFGLDKTDYVEPGDIFELEIDLWATGVLINHGEALRLEISSSAAPKFAPHFNTTENQGEAIEALIVKQQIFHTQNYQSRLEIEVIDN